MAAFASFRSKICRNSSFELLRLVLMFLIIVHHAITVLGLYRADTSEMIIQHEDLLLFCIVNCFCIPAVNIFVLISGVFAIKPTATKVLSLLVSMLFYTLFFTLPYLLYTKDFFHALSSLFILSHSPYWFLIDYLFLMLFAPLLNMMFQYSNKKYITLFILGLLFISIYFGFVWGHTANTNGYTLLQFIMLYCIGRYIAVYDIRSPRRNILIFIYAAASILCGYGMYVCMGQATHRELARHLTFYNNPLVILSSIALFLFFKETHFKSKTVNKLAKSSLSVYLLSCSKFFWICVFPIIPLFYRHAKSGFIFLVGVAVFAIITMAISIGIDQVQIRVNRYFTKYISNKLHLIEKSADIGSAE